MRQLKIVKSITVRESFSFDKYLTEVSKEALISVEEEISLAKRIREGDAQALEKLTRANLRFVISVAKQYQNQGVSLTDLICEGNLGLIKAAQKYDETRGFKFISYAVWWIRQSIIQAIAVQSRIVRLPLNKVGILNSINKANALFEQKEERFPSIKELSDILGLDTSVIKDALSSSGKHTSISASFIEGEENSLLDILENDEPSSDSVLEGESLSFEIDRLIKLVLDEREALIVRMFFGLGYQEMTMDEIAPIFNLTRERTRQIKEKAVRKMRYRTRSKILQSYLG